MPSSQFDFIPSSNAPARITNERVEGAVPPADYNGLDVTGSYGRALLIESYFIPQGWAAIVASTGVGSESNVVGFREHTNPAAAVALQITENASYTPPVIVAHRQGWLAMGFDRKWCGDRENARGSADTGASEFSWGPGPVTPGAEFAPPRDGGKYNGRSPDMSEPRRRYRRGDPAPGYPGEIVAQ